MYKLAIVGATGLVGRTVLKILEEKDLPIYEYVLFASKKSAGSVIHFRDKDYIVTELTENSFSNEHFDFAIFSAGRETSLRYSPLAAQNDCIVVDNSSAFRMEKDVPLVVPEVNPEDIKLNKGIIANPNCSTIQAMLPIKALDKKYNVKRIVYSTYQAVSGAGRYGIEDLENSYKNLPLKKFPYPIYNNCLPHIDVFNENGYTKEEEKMINETRKILHKPDLKITATCVRVPVINCHCESINLEFEKEFDLEDVYHTLENFENITVIDNTKENLYPLPTKVSGKDNVFVGRIRRDYSIENGLNLWVVADNIRKGAATNAIQILEKLFNKENHSI